MQAAELERAPAQRCHRLACDGLGRHGSARLGEASAGKEGGSGIGWAEGEHVDRLAAKLNCQRSGKMKLKGL